MFGPPLLPAPAVELDRVTGAGDPTKLIMSAKSQRDRVTGVYDEAVSYTMPGKPGIASNAYSLPIYDDTAVEGMADCTSRICEGIIPNYARWTSFIAGFMVPDEQREEVQQKLQYVDQFLFEQVSASNFGLEASESMSDAIVGTGAIDISESAGSSAFNCRAIPHGNLLFLIGPDGMPDPIWEVRRGSPYHAQVLFPGAKMPSMTEQTPAEVDFIECWQRLWDEPTKMKYRRTVWVDGKPNEFLIDEQHQGDGCCPKIVFRWSKGSGEGWGRGPAINKLSSIRKVNFAEQLLLDHGEMALAGFWTVEDDGVVNPNTVRVEPGALVPIAMGSEGLKNVAPGANFDLNAYLLEEARKSIRHGFFMDELGDPNRSPKKATEIDARMAELARRVGTPMGRLLLEFVVPSVNRFVYILKKRGLIKMPAIDGKTVKLMPTSPLAQAQRFEDIDAMTAYARLLREAFPEGHATTLMIAEDRYGEELAAKLQVPTRILRTREERANVAATGLQAAGMGGDQNAGSVTGAAGGDELEGELPPPAPDDLAAAA